jgi:hypothetical protein
MSQIDPHQGKQYRNGLHPHEIRKKEKGLETSFIFISLIVKTFNQYYSDLRNQDMF